MVVAAQFKDAHTFRLAFVLPYGLLIEALIALVGAEFERVHDLIDRAESAGRAAGDDLLTTIATSIRTRSLVAQGRFKEAISVSMRNLGEITPSAHGEVIASRAIALACNREDERALSTAELAGQTTSAIEATVCSAAARAIVAGNRAESNVFELAKVALESATAHHCVECFMAAYRGSPELARVLLAADETREPMLRVLSIADDADRFDPQASGVAGTWESLSKRERDVLALVADGHSNRAIGQLLYIAEATVKVHMSHIFEKLQVSSRTAAALRLPHHARAKPRLGSEPGREENP